MSEVAYDPTTEQDLDELLNNHSGNQGVHADEIDINSSAQIDTSGDTRRDKWPAGTYPVRSTGLRVTKSNSGERNLMAVVTFTCQAGPLKGLKREEFLMLGGKGVTKTCYFLDAVGLYDRDNKKILFKTYSEMLDKDCWIVVEHVKQTSKKGTEFIADAIPFQEGFLSFLDASGKPRFAMPDDNDPFADPGQVETPAAAPKAPASTATPPIVSAGAESKPNW